jgi:hypothetical protein
VPESDIFQTIDLSEKKDIAMVTSTIFGLGSAVSENFFLKKSSGLLMLYSNITVYLMMVDLQAPGMAGTQFGT